MTSTETSDYRFSSPFVTRFVGAYLLVFALLVFVSTAVVAITDAVSPDLLVVLLVVGLVGLFALGGWLRSKAYVVRLGAEGYEVRMIRGAGVKRAAWSEVEDVVAASPRGIPCIVLHLSGDRTTTVPVEALAVDRDQFVRELQGHLDRGQGLRPL